MQIFSVKLQKIESQIDYFTNCICCNKALKKAYWTDHGPMGMNCFLATIGLPRISSQNKKSPKLTQDQYENMAAAIIIEYERLSNELITAYYQKYYGWVKSIERIGQTYYHIEYYNRDNIEAKDNFNILIYQHSHDLYQMIGVPSDMIDILRGTKIMSQYYHETLITGHLNWIRIF